MKQQPFASPEEALRALQHHGVKGMRWGVVKEDIPSGFNPSKKIAPGTPEFQQLIERVTRTDHPQILMPGSLPSVPKSGSKSGTKTDESGKIAAAPQEHHGLTRNQKMLITFGAVSAAAAGYYAYQHYTGSKMTGLDIAKIQQDEKVLSGITLPKKWDVSSLKNGPISTRPLGDLAGGDINFKLKDAENLVINTSRGYADILPKNGFSNPFAAEQHASAVRVLEEFRDKFPSVRNMNIELLPMSAAPGMENTNAHMCVLPMRAGEARLMYNDLMDKPTAQIIRDNRNFLPGLGAKDYVARHEMGHILAVAGGQLPPTHDLFSANAGPSVIEKYHRAEPLLHKRMFAKHGFTFRELAKISGYAATEPAEAMAELVGHATTPEMQSRLTPDQLQRATAMINEMGGLA